jgi:hypothetical protein
MRELRSIQTTAERIVHDSLERPMLLPRFFVEPAGDIVIKRQRCTSGHAMMITDRVTGPYDSRQP